MTKIRLCEKVTDEIFYRRKISRTTIVGAGFSNTQIYTGASCFKRYFYVSVVKQLAYFFCLPPRSRPIQIGVIWETCNLIECSTHTTANLRRHGAAFSEQLHQMLGREEGGRKPQLARLAYNGFDRISATRYIYRKSWIKNTDKENQRTKLAPVRDDVSRGVSSSRPLDSCMEGRERLVREEASYV